MGFSELSASSNSALSPGSSVRPKPSSRLPFFGFPAAGSGNTPLRERKNRGFHNRRNRALRTRVKFADGFDGVAEKFKANGTRRFRREYIDDSAADGKLAGKFDHFRSRVADARKMRGQFFVIGFCYPSRVCARE